jgi:hypothetical protein
MFQPLLQPRTVRLRNIHTTKLSNKDINYYHHDFVLNTLLCENSSKYGKIIRKLEEQGLLSGAVKYILNSKSGSLYEVKVNKTVKGGEVNTSLKNLAI